MTTMLRRAARTEGAMWRGLFRWVLRRPTTVGRDEQPFAYVGVVKPYLIIFIVLSAVEIPLFDWIIRLAVPWHPARWIFLVLGVWGLLWMLGFAALLAQRPHLAGRDRILVRAGTGVDLAVPREDIASVSKHVRQMDGARSLHLAEEGERRVLSLVLGSQTNVDLRLSRPLRFDLPKGRTEPIDELRLWADDPDGFCRA